MRVQYALVALLVYLTVIGVDASEKGAGRGAGAGAGAGAGGAARGAAGAGGAGGRASGAGGAGGAEAVAPKCPAEDATLAGVADGALLPNRILANRDARITPLTYFELPAGNKLGEGAFGSVTVGFLKDSVPTDAEKAEGLARRSFAIKKQTYTEGAIDIIQKKTEMASVSEPQWMKTLNGGPYTIHYWGGWKTPGPDDGQKSFYIVMPVAKSDIESEIKGKGKFYKNVGGKIPLEKAKIMIAQLVIAIGHAHQKGMIHRDIKPGNVLLDEKRRVMLADFGCAVGVDTLAQEWEAAGNCDYHITPPEVMFNKRIMEKAPVGAVPYGPSADWWSLGVTAYNILAKNPTEGPRGPFKQDAQRVFSVLAQGFKRRLKRSEYLNYARWTEAGLDDVARDFIKQLLNYDQRARLGSPVSGRKKTGWHEVLCHPFFNSIDSDRLVAAGRKQAEEANAKIAFATKDKKPPEPSAAKSEKPTLERMKALDLLSSASKSVYSSYLAYDDGRPYDYVDEDGDGGDGGGGDDDDDDSSSGGGGGSGYYNGYYSYNSYDDDLGEEPAGGWKNSAYAAYFLREDESHRKPVAKGGAAKGGAAKSGGAKGGKLARREAVRLEIEAKKARLA